MSRIRYLKPEFFLDEDVAALSFPARLLFQGLWVLADREGRLEDRPALIRVQVFPYEGDILIGDLLDELARERKHSPGAFIRRYSVDGQRFIQINSFSAHQKPHPREAASAIPAYKEDTGRKKARPSRAKVLPGQEKDVSSRMGNGEGEGNGEWGREGAGTPPDPPRELTDDERAEKEIRAQTGILERRLYASVARLSERTGRDTLGLMRQVTAYRGKDGSTVPGRANPSGLTAERLEKSIEDAEAWLADLDKHGAPA